MSRIKNFSLIFLCAVYLLIQGCALPKVYRPVVTAPDASKVKVSKQASKRKIAIRYMGNNELYSDVQVSSQFIYINENNRKAAMGSESELTNLPVATNYALLLELSKKFETVEIWSKDRKDKYKNWHVLEYKFDQLDVTGVLYKDGGVLSVPVASEAVSNTSIAYEIKRNGKRLSHGAAKATAKDKNSKEEHKALEVIADKLMANAFSMAALAQNFATYGIQPQTDLTHRVDDPTGWTQRWQIVGSLHSFDTPKFNLKIKNNKFNKKSWKNVMSKYKGTIQDPPLNLESHSKGMAWFGPYNFSLYRALTYSSEKATTRLLKKVISDISR